MTRTPHQTLVAALLTALGFLHFSASASSSQQTPSSADLPEVETRDFVMEGCVPFFRVEGRQLVIRESEALRAAVRRDASRPRCLKTVESLDFNRHTLLGIQLNTGYCRKPVGLEYRLLKDEAQKRFLLLISYTEPVSSCRALSQYDLWVLAPKLPDGYEVRFAVQPRPRKG